MKKFIMVIIALLFGMTTMAASAATFTQADLTGTWAFHMLRKGYQSNGTTPRNEWVRGRLSIDASGNVSCLSMSNSTDSTGCPGTVDWQMTIDASGVISETGANAASLGHGTMTASKNFIAATGSSGNPSYHLAIFQKVTGVSYSAADVVNKSFVYHSLLVSSTMNGWIYGDGTTDASGLTTLGGYTNSWGNTSQNNELNGTFSVDSNGDVTLEGNTNIHGFMSDDKKTIVVTDYWEVGKVSLYIIQITGQTYTAGLLPAQTSAVHLLGANASNFAFWVHYTNTVDSSGVFSFSDWVPSSPGVTAPVGTYTGSITSSGTVTIAGNPTYHGQASHDGTFTVGTDTGPGPVYMLNVSTHASPLVCSSKKAKVNADYFDTLQEAYNGAADGDTLQIQEYLFTEDVLLDRNITTILKGGYNCQYETNTGYTTVNGSITITNGTVTVENIIIK